MVDTGATYSCIGSKGIKILLSGSSVKTVGFSGTVQITPLTQPVNITIAGKTIRSSLLYAKNTPVNLLGRDILCPLKAVIECTHNGLRVDFPDDVTHRIMMMNPEKRQLKLDQAVIYWVRVTDESKLKKEWSSWNTQITECYSTWYIPEMPTHCTLYYDQAGEDLDYAECWEELINSKTFHINCLCVYVGPEGAAAAVSLPPALQEWFQVQGSCPHVTLVVAGGHSAWELGPMVKAASKISEWHPTDIDDMWGNP